MTNQLVNLHRSLPAVPQVDRRLNRQLTRQVNHMAAIAEVTKSGMSEIGQITAYATFEMIRTHSTINLFEQAAIASRTLTPEEQQALAILKQDMQISIIQTAEQAHAKIVALIANLPPAAALSIWDELADFLGI